nr:efflux RND transporter permease subunit [Spelaeicoccus albus]
MVLFIWLGALVVIGSFAGAFSKAFDDQFTLPGTQSQEAMDSLSHTFPQASGSNAQIVFQAPDGDSVRSSNIKSALQADVKSIKQFNQVSNVSSPYDKHIHGAIAAGGKAAIITVQLDGERAEITQGTKNKLQDVATELEKKFPQSKAEAGGDAFGMTGVQVSVTEAIGVVIALVVLFLTLGSFRAAGMPLLTALLGVGISMMLVVGATAFATVSSTTPMLALMLGLAVGIDYALFILSRHRDQLGEGMETEESAARSVATAGSAVVFAGLTVIIALAGLSVAGIPFLTTMGIAAAAAVAIAVMIALTLLPALLGFAGDKLRPKVKRVSKKKRGHTSKQPREKRAFFRGWITAVTKWPPLTIAIVVVGLAVVSLPATSLKLALPDNGTSAKGTPARITYDMISKNFGPGYNGPLIVTANIVGSDDPLGVMDGIESDIKKMPDVAAVPLATPNEDADTGIVQVTPKSAPDSQATKDLVNRIRDKSGHWEDKYGVTTAVTGFTAVGIDVSDKLGSALLPFGILVVGLSIVLLTMVFRSIAVPIKATVGYLLSVGASFGVVSLVFGHGWFADALNVGHTGPVISFLPIILMGILFGLAMDYEVFLVSRIREDFVHGGDAKHAIRTGFLGASTVVTAAAVIMFSVFAAFVPEGEPAIKAIGLGLAVGVFVDAFLVRMTLVPAVLALLGRHAWWLPAWLDRVLPSFDVEGEALHHQIQLQNWPSADDDSAIYADGLSLQNVHGKTVFEGVSMRLERGGVLLIDGSRDSGRSQLMLTLAGRMKLQGGRAKVLGNVLPEQSTGVRRHTGYITGSDADDLTRIARRVLGRGPDIVFIDDADMLLAHADRAKIAEMSERAGSGQGPAIVLGATNPEILTDLLPPGTTRISMYNPALNVEGAR